MNTFCITNYKHNNVTTVSTISIVRSGSINPSGTMKLNGVKADVYVVSMVQIWIIHWMEQEQTNCNWWQNYSNVIGYFSNITGW